MFRTILVPLDGSVLAEKALPPALQIARRAGATLHLTCVLTPQARTDNPLHPGIPRDEQTALDLSAWRVRQAAPGLSVQTSLVEGPVAPMLAEHAAAVGANLIVMTTHGRGSLSRFWLGSVTDEMVRRTTVPLLVLRPADYAPAVMGTEMPIRRVIVPLDGAAFADKALGPAAALARPFGAELHLVHVVTPIPTNGPDGVVYAQTNDYGLVFEEMKRKGAAMLDRAATRVAAEGVKVTTRVVVAERVAEAILEEARPGDVIGLATHARAPATRWLLGSVADKLIRAADVPVLVVRPNGKLT
jgi:nucleotide-binding universal stress UspA family protein